MRRTRASWRLTARSALSLVAYFDKMSRGYQNLSVRLRKRERKNRRLQLMRGEVPEQLVEQVAVLRESFEQLQRSLAVLADLLDKDMPEQPPDEDDDEETKMMMEVRARARGPLRRRA